MCIYMTLYQGCMQRTERKSYKSKQRIKFSLGNKDWQKLINTYWISIWGIWRLHPLKNKNTGSLAYTLHERKEYYEIMR